MRSGLGRRAGIIHMNVCVRERDDGGDDSVEGGREESGQPSDGPRLGQCLCPSSWHLFVLVDE